MGSLLCVQVSVPRTAYSSWDLSAPQGLPRRRPLPTNIEQVDDIEQAFSVFSRRIILSWNLCQLGKDCCNAEIIVTRKLAKSH